MKKGFTLIELLAVIVILAILALIAVPIIFNIIDNANINSKKVSGENYLKAVEFSVAQSVLEGKRLKDGTYPIMSNGNVCRVEPTEETCPNELVVEVKGETPEIGEITISGGKITSYKFEFNSGYVMTNEICTLVSGTAKEIGSKYKCEVSKGTFYNFYVLSINDGEGSLNLIMENNIYYDAEMDISGIASTSGNLGRVAWYADSSVTNYGPVTAMEYLHNATKSWVNVPNVYMNYTDEGSQYGTIITMGTLNPVTKITSNTGTVLENGQYINMKARLPMRGELDAQGCDGTGQVSCAIWLSDSDLSSAGIKGYWSLASADASSSYRVRWNRASGKTAVTDATYGIRPVITINL